MCRKSRIPSLPPVPAHANSSSDIQSQPYDLNILQPLVETFLVLRY